MNVVGYVDVNRAEAVELTTICLIRNGDKYLLQKREKENWKGYALPGGHIEINESIVKSVIREIKEETGLTIEKPRLCGIKNFSTIGNNSRYIVFMFIADKYDGEIVPSDEGELYWVDKNELNNLELAMGMKETLKVMLDRDMSEIYYTNGCNLEWDSESL